MWFPDVCSSGIALSRAAQKSVPHQGIDNKWLKFYTKAMLNEFFITEILHQVEPITDYCKIRMCLLLLEVQ